MHGDAEQQHTRVYLDNHATTPMDPRVVDVVVHHMRETFGNPNSADHAFGDSAARVVDEATAHVAALVGAEPESVIFTAGATESINFALQGFARWGVRRFGRPMRIAVSAIEHRAVIATANALAAEGLVALSILPVDAQAHVDLDAVQRMLGDGIDLIAVMAANHEVGTIQPVAEIGALAASAGSVFLCDATQAVGKIPVNVIASGISYLAMSAHKLYGPKGVGALVLGSASPLASVSFGGSQQSGRRPGTLNVPGIAGFGEACRLRRLEMAADERRIAQLRDELQREIQDQVTDVVINGDPEGRLAGNLHVSIPDVPNQAVIARVRERLAISTGAACTSGIEEPSHVLQAMRLPQALQDGALRFGLGKFTTESDATIAAREVAGAVNAIRTAAMAN